jgi:hypothetical protein
VRPFKDEALYWKALWESAGKKKNHTLFTNMKSSSKYTIRRLKKSAEQVQNNAFLDSIIQGKSGSIYKEVKKFRGQQQTVSSRIDEEVGSRQIADHFAYQDLYGKCQLESEFCDLKNTVEEKIVEEEMIEVVKIDEQLVKE